MLAPSRLFWKKCSNPNIMIKVTSLRIEEAVTKDGDYGEWKSPHPKKEPDCFSPVTIHPRKRRQRARPVCSIS